ncbi:MAG: dienelactone hydrolase family protein [Acidimicrobiia bacterium]|nr:dienelactone hydrolase family protein [Acidimicrobiia bacterium]
MYDRWPCIVVLTALLIGACGNGGDGTDTATNVAPATESTTAPTAVPPTPAPPPATPTPAPSPTPEPTTSAGEKVACTSAPIESGAVTLSGERCAPGATDVGPRPAVVVLNGCGGYEADSDITAAIVRALAERGVIGLRIDYLAAEPAPADTYCDAGAVIGAAQPLLQAVVDGVVHLRADPDVDPERIGAAGYSLGALAAMAAQLGGAGLTTVTPLDLTAVALLSYPDQLPTVSIAAGEGRVPPLFLMTGEDDSTAPPEDAQALVDAATVGGVPTELLLVPGQDHPWRGDAATSAGAVIADYLARQLGA